MLTWSEELILYKRISEPMRYFPNACVLRSRLALIIATFALLSICAVKAELSESDFRDPPIQARPSALWTWLNGYVDLKQITHELEEMKAKGMRGAVIWDLGSIADPQKIIPKGPAFLGTESLVAIHHAIDEAERLGLELGLVASSSWNAGGPWIKPEDGAKKLVWSELRLEGPQEFSGELPLPDKINPHFQNVAIMAIPQQDSRSQLDRKTVIPLDKYLANDGRLSWSVPAGKWSILRFISSNTGQPLVCPSPASSGLMIDHLSRKATEAHWNHLLDTLRAGRTGYGSLKTLMLDSYEVADATDWTPEFIKEFVSAYGYNPTPWLPVLAKRMIGNEDLTKRFLHDYRKLVGDLIVKDHFVRSREMLNQRGLQLLAEGGHGGHARVDPLKALGAADIPMGEFWNHRKNWVTKEAASASHIYGKQLVNAETLTGWQNWQDGPATYKRLFDIALCAGLNQVTFHTLAHNPPSAGLPGFAYHAGEHFNVNSTWWNEAGPMLKDVSRCCHLLQQGRFVADVCVYYGDDAPNLVPARRLPPDITPGWSDGNCQHCGKPKPVDLSSLGHGHDYDYINEEVLLGRMEYRNGRLVLPDGMNYRLLVLPDREAISPVVLHKIAELVKEGANVVGRKPQQSNSLHSYPDCDAEVRALANEIWGDCDGEKIRVHSYGKGKVIWNRPLDEILAEMNVTPDFIVENFENADQKIDFIHRETEDEDIYFVSNSSMDSQEVSCRFRAAQGRIPSLWNAENGTVKPCHLYEVDKGSIRVPLALSPASSVFVIFRKSAPADHIVRIEHLGKNAGGGMEILSMDADTVSARVTSPGLYSVKTAKGRSGSVNVNVPPNQMIEGPWKLTFPEGRGAPPYLTIDKLADWTTLPDEGVRYFSGTTVYQKSIEIADAPAGNVFLDLGRVKEVASVRINGKEAGILWKQPYRIDVSSLLKIGANHIEISVTNLWNNRIVGDLQREGDQDFTNTNLKFKFTAKSPLLSSGLIGPVTLRSSLSVTLALKP